jgi:hypothetical protein
MTPEAIFTITDTRDQAKRAIISHLIRRTVGVINQVRIAGTHAVTGQPGDSEVSGKGCLVRWRGKFLVLTAKHVLDTTTGPNDIRIVSFGASPIAFKSAARITLADADAGVVLNSESKIFLCEWEDLAAVTLPDDSFGEYADVRDEWEDPSAGAMVGSIGFPFDNNVTVERRMIGNKEEVGIGIMPVLLDTDVLAPPSDDDLKFNTPAHDETRHYMVSYTSALSQQPHGMSGAAMWVPDMRGMIWSPKFLFAGTCISVYMKGYSCHRGPVLQVVRASVVRKFLEETFGDC